MSRYIETEVTSENLEELKQYMDETEYNITCQILPVIDEEGWVFEFRNENYTSDYIDCIQKITVVRDTYRGYSYVEITSNDGEEYATDQYLGKEKGETTWVIVAKPHHQYWAVRQTGDEWTCTFSSVLPDLEYHYIVITDGETEYLYVSDDDKEAEKILESFVQDDKYASEGSKFSWRWYDPEEDK